VFFLPEPERCPARRCRERGGSGDLCQVPADRAGGRQQFVAPGLRQSGWAHRENDREPVNLTGRRKDASTHPVAAGRATLRQVSEMKKPSDISWMPPNQLGEIVRSGTTHEVARVCDRRAVLEVIGYSWIVAGEETRPRERSSPTIRILSLCRLHVIAFVAVMSAGRG